jgi:hypothetical protein
MQISHLGFDQCVLSSLYYVYFNLLLPLGSHLLLSLGSHLLGESKLSVVLRQLLLASSLMLTILLPTLSHDVSLSLMEI